MSAQVVVVLGPARAGKTHELVSRYHDALAGGQPAGLERLLWLAPSSRAATVVREALIARFGGACLAPGITTFDDLSQQIVLAAKLRIRPISPVLQRELLRRTLARAVETKRLSFFAEAAHRAGFIDLLIEHIRELRQRGVRPPAYERIAAARGESPQHQELALLYADYDRQLTAHGLCDAEGIHWAARDALASGSCSRFAELDLVVVDGFTDFTRTQHEVLRHLAARAQQLCISLPTDSEGAAARPDLFAKTAATLAELKQFFPRLKTHHLAPRPSASRALDHISQQVFRHPQPLPPADVLDSLDSIEIVEAAGAQDEIIQLARRIKALLSEKGSGLFLGEPAALLSRSAKRVLTPFPVPDDIVVVFRSVTDVAPRIEEVFGRFGIPYSIESSLRIARSAVVRSLVALLQLDADDWPFRRVVSIITNNTLSAIAEPARQAADWLVRELQLASGRRKLLEIVAGLADRANDAQEFSEFHQRRITAAAAAIPALTLLTGALDNLPQEATAAEWTAALTQLGAALALPPFTSQTTAQRTGRFSDQWKASTDFAAWNAIVGDFTALERLDAWLGEPPRKLNRREMLSLLIDVATHEELPRLHDDVGRVRVLSAASARAAPARHLFFAGMSEQAFPAGVRAGRLANDGDYRFFANAAHQNGSAEPSPSGRGQGEGALESPAATRSQDEMLLFYEVLSRAQESLTISYAAMDDKAQVLPPSPYVVELQRMFRNGEQKISCAKPRLSPVPPPSRSAEPRRTPADEASMCRSARGTYCVADWRVAAVAEAAQTDGDRRLLAGFFSRDETRSLGQAIDAGVRIVHARARGESFGPSEGLLIGPAAAAHLGQRFGAKHSWSPSQLETYAACPYKFFLADVLQLEPLGELALETDFARRGSLLHQVLAAFHRRHGESASEWSALWRDESRFAAELKNVLQAAIEATPREGLEAALLELDRRQIDKWTDLYRGQHEKYDDAWSKLDEPPRPTHFELRFGRKHAGEAGHEDPRSTDDAFQLDIGGGSINVAGRIDRIDVGRAGERTVFNVIDYKSGRRPTLTSEKIESGERLQPALYVMAAEGLVFSAESATPLWAGYWSMQGGVTTNKKYSLHCAVESGEPAESWEKLRPKVIARIGEIVRAARRGDFPVASRDLNCTSFCEFKTVCRVAQVRSVGKVWTPGDA